MPAEQLCSYSYVYFEIDKCKFQIGLSVSDALALFDCSSGPGRSKITMLLVNVSLKFRTLISNICQYFFNKKYQYIWL